VTIASPADARPSNFALINAVALAMLMIAGCATTQPLPSDQTEFTSTGQTHPDVSALTNAMAERDRALESMQTNAVMEFTNGADHVKAREEIIVRRPSSLRVEAMSPFGVALIVAAQESRLQIFEPSKNTLMRGTADAATLARFARIPMAPRDAVGLLMGIVPEAQKTSAPDSVTNDGDVTMLGYDLPDHSRRELGFENSELVMVRQKDATGSVSLEIRYADYHDIGGVMFAYHVEANFPAVETHVSFIYKRPIVNGKIPDSVFILTPGANAKQVDIGMTSGLKVPRDA
jgi:hypothetical protein